MADTIASLTALIGVDVSGFQKGLSSVKSDLGSFASTIKDVGIGAVIGLGAAMVGFGTASVAAASESELAMAKFAAVLKSTGGAAGVTETAALNLAAALQKTTRYSHEQVLSAEAVLLRFNQIGKDAFPQATQMALDMATALDMDTDSAAKMLGRMLESADGLAMATRQGVHFTDQQKQQIKEFYATGQAAKAQGIIMAELQKQFGGAAEAAGNTFAGSLDKLHHALNDIFETVGGLLLPGLTALATGFANIARGAGEGLQNFIQTISDAFASGNLGKLLDNISKGLSPIIFNILRGLGIDSTGAAIAAQQISKFFQGVSKSISDAINTLFPKDAIGVLGSQMGHMAGMEGADQKQVTSSFVDRLKKMLGITPDVEAQIGAVFGQIKAAMVPILKDLVEGIKGFFDNMKGMDTSGIIKIVQGVAQINLMVLGLVVSGAAAIIDAVAKVLPQLGLAIKGLADALSGAMNGDFGKLKEGFINFITNLSNAVGGFQITILQDIINAIRDMLGLKGDFSVLNTFKDTLDRLAAAFNAVANGINAAKEAARGNAGASGSAGEVPAGIKSKTNASGGPVSAGEVYKVNEYGTEMFRPAVDGRVIPIGASSGEGKSVTFIITNYISNPDPKAVLAAVKQAAKDKGENW